VTDKPFYGDTMLYIIRHGKTDWNAQYKLQGRTDIPLNDEGRSMALKAGEECREIHFDVCYCSPLVRAKETAELLLKGRDVPIIYDDRLKEMSFGIYEGTVDCFHSDLPVKTIFLEPEKYTEAFEGAESWDDLFARTGEFLREVVDPLLKDNKDVLIVGHGAMNLSIINQVWNIPLKDYWSTGIENCKLYKLK